MAPGDESSHATLDIVLREISGVRGEIAQLRHETVEATAATHRRIDGHEQEHRALVEDRNAKILALSKDAARQAEHIADLAENFSALRRQVNHRTLLGGVAAAIGGAVVFLAERMGVGKP